MAKVRKRNIPPVKLAGMSGEKLRDNLNGLRKRAVVRDGVTTYENVDLANDFMINVDAKLFTGGTTVKEDGSKGYMGLASTIGVNIATMSNLDPDLLDALGVELTDEQAQAVANGTCNPLYNGNFDVENNGIDFSEFKTYPDGEHALKSTPVGLKVEIDPDANNVKSELGKYTITPAIDFHALGTASTAEQNRIRETRGKDPLKPGQADRIKVVTSLPVTKDGLGGMNAGRVNQNLAKCAAANGLMGRAEDALPTPEQIEKVSALYTATFDKLVKDLSGKKGVTVAGIKDPTNTVSCKPLSELGIQAKQVNGATVLTVVGGEDSKQARRDGLKEFNDVFNARWKQVVNERDPKDPNKYVQDPTTVALGNQMSLNSRAVTVRNPFDRNKKTGLVLVQPGMDFTSTPYADKLGMSVGSAMHGLLEGTTPESLYGEERMAAADKLSKAFDDPNGPTAPEVAIQANAAQFKAICEANGKDYEETLKAPAKGEVESEGIDNDREMDD